MTRAVAALRFGSLSVLSYEIADIEPAEGAAMLPGFIKIISCLEKNM